MAYGKEPIIVQKFLDSDIDNTQMMYYQYLPIKLKDSSLMKIPERLKAYNPLIDTAMNDYMKDHGIVALMSKYVYVTLKNIYVTKEAPGNRPGLHVDGWGSNGDINYIYHSKNPTEFIIQDFKDIPDDDFESMEAFEQQSNQENVVVYENNTLLKLDEEVVHRVGPVEADGMRCFFKLSISDHVFNLAGNSHNYLLDYNWEMYDRKKVRNIDNRDYVNSPAPNVNHPMCYPKHSTDKGQIHGGECNRTACKNENAVYWNLETFGFYCSRCANEINKFSPNAKPIVSYVPKKPTFEEMDKLKKEYYQ